MVAAYSNRDAGHEAELKKLIEKNGIGGLIFFQGGPIREVDMYNRLQTDSNIPLWVGMDAEWGLSMRLDSTYAFPWNMTLGAVEDNELIKQVGQQVAKHCKRLGVHINFAPVVDINTNPKNPIIGNRSFGEDRDNVTEKASAFMKGMQDAGVLANAKHFPGHGDTDQDSHKTLPTISFNEKRIDSVELYPYKKLIKEVKSSFKDQFNLRLLDEDLHKGIYLASNIPKGYGAGSSGAFCASILKRYGLEKINESPQKLKELLKYRLN